MTLQAWQCAQYKQMDRYTAMTAWICLGVGIKGNFRVGVVAGAYNFVTCTVPLYSLHSMRGHVESKIVHVQGLSPSRPFARAVGSLSRIANMASPEPYKTSGQFYRVGKLTTFMVWNYIMQTRKAALPSCIQRQVTFEKTHVQMLEYGTEATTAIQVLACQAVLGYTCKA